MQAELAFLLVLQSVDRLPITWTRIELHSRPPSVVQVAQTARVGVARVIRALVARLESEMLREETSHILAIFVEALTSADTLYQAILAHGMAASLAPSQHMRRR